MSGYIVGRVLWADLPAHLKLTSVIIADAANDEGYAFPGLARIAKQLGQSERQVRNNITDLKRRGILTVTSRGKSGGGRSSNAYQFNLDALPLPPNANRQQASAMEGQSGNGLPVKTGNPAQANRKSSAGKPEIQRRQTGNSYFRGTVSRPVSKSNVQAFGSDDGGRTEDSLHARRSGDRRVDAGTHPEGLPGIRRQDGPAGLG